MRKKDRFPVADWADHTANYWQYKQKSAFSEYYFVMLLNGFKQQPWQDKYCTEFKIVKF